MRTLIFFFFFIPFLLVASELNLTEEEKKWIEKSSSITLGADYNWPPFDFVDSRGNHVGLSADYLDLISKKTGLKFDIVANKWSKIIANMKNDKYHGLSCAVKSDKRKKYLFFTEPYLSVPVVVITNKNNINIQNINNLRGKIVSINKGSYVHEWLKKKHPDIKLHLTSSNEESIQAVSHGIADVYLGNLAVANYIMNKFLINNLKVVFAVEGFDTQLSIAISKKHYILLNIIQKALSSISYEEHQRIKSKWKKSLAFDKEALLLDFTTEQSKWINKHKKIDYVVDNLWFPIEFFDNQKQIHAGVSRSYLDLINKKTGLEFNLVKTDTWDEAIEKLKNKEVQLMPTMAKTKHREKFMNFSTPYMNMPEVFVTKKDIGVVRSIQSVYGKKLALVKGYYITELIKKQHPLIQVIETTSTVKALEMVTKGEAFAYMDITPVASYYIQKKGFHNLKISGVSDYRFDFSIAFHKGIAKEGIEVINKALNSISEEEKNSIYNKWLHVKYDKEIDYTIVWQFLGLFLFFIGGTLFWNKKLSNEIEKRKIFQKELINLNKELKRAKRVAQDASMAKSIFLSNMSHEIRTPMNAILGFAELLDEKIEDKKLHSYVKTIRKSGENLLVLINQILDLSKIESGKLEIVKRPSNIKQLFKDIEDLFILQAKQKKLSFNIKIDENLPLSLLVDTFRLKEILINLVGNAIKFTENGGVFIWVKAEAIYNHLSKVDLKIEVQDTGIGIPKQSQHKIFNSFEQVENQDVRKYRGTGLGLAICKKLAENMNGSLTVKSKTNKGSTFILCIKQIDIASLEQTTREEDALDFHHLKFDEASILVVDDIDENRELVKECFFETKVNIFEAKDGQEAVNKAKEESYDVILMDIRMPKMDGYTATKTIKEFSKVPIVALTASIMQEEYKKIKKENFDGYLRKPINKRKLFKELSKYIKTTKKSPQPTQKDDVLIIKNTKEEIKDFYIKLDTNIIPLYEKAVKTNDFALIEEFAKDLNNLAKKYSIRSVEKYSEDLLDKIAVFDIGAITTHLEKFPSIKEQIKAKL